MLGQNKTIGTIALFNSNSFLFLHSLVFHTNLKLIISNPSVCYTFDITY